MTKNFITEQKINELKKAADILSKGYMSDIEITKLFTPESIKAIADKLDISEDCVEPYGKTKAKLSIERSPKGKLILVTAINPTAAGEGKTTTSIGLADGLALSGEKTCVVLREPSLGPVFGVKGGATGGGLSQVIPMQDINLHFTGDIHAVTAANNLLSALIDNHLQQGNILNINPKKIVWERCVDLNDRSLRNVIIGAGSNSDGVLRADKFNISAASEVMAILCLARGIEDLKERLGNILIAYNNSDEPIYARQLNANNAMAILLSEAIKPNLVQTLIGTPAIIHGGPFANMAHGCNSIMATETALTKADYVVTEAGFGADLGAEKFLNFKCRLLSRAPDCVVLVATVRALKLNGGLDKNSLNAENISALNKGLANINKHIENLINFNIRVVVSINRFATDSEAELKLIIDNCAAKGVKCVVSNIWGEGGLGASDMVAAVKEQCQKGAATINHTYDLQNSVTEKVEKIAMNVYGASRVIFTPTAITKLKQIEKLGYSDLPVIMAKTQFSFSDDPKLLGCPKGFDITVRDILIRSGCGFLVCVAGDIMLMPGLPKSPASDKMDIDESGNITGLF